MTSRYRPPGKPLEPLESWQVDPNKARLGEVAGCGCALVFLGLIAAFFFWASTSEPEFGSDEVSAEEYALLFDVGYIADLSPDPIDRAFEGTLRDPSPGGVELQYVYEPDVGPYIYTAVWVGDLSRVPRKYQEYRTFIDEFGGDEVTRTVLPNACRWGLDSQCGIYLHQGQPAGNYFFANQGRATLFVQILNIYWDTGEDLDNIFLPYLETLEAGLE